MLTCGTPHGGPANVRSHECGGGHDEIGVATAQNGRIFPGTLARSAARHQDDRKAARLGFEHGVVGRLTLARRHEKICRCEQLGHLRIGHVAEKQRVRTPVLQFEQRGTIAGNDEPVHRVRSAKRELERDETTGPMFARQGSGVNHGGASV